jgi:dipeptidyl aminopeptidase/acylaminoacyl peptidase
VRKLGFFTAFAAAFIAACSANAQTAVSAATDRPTIEALSELPFLTDPALSADGYRIAARVTTEGKNWIGVWDLRAAPDAPPHQLSTGDYDIRWLRWAGPRRLLLGVLMTRRYMGIDVPLTRMVSVDVDTWQVMALQTGEGLMGDDVIFVDPHGDYALVSSQPSWNEYPAVVRVDLATGRGSVVQRPRDGVWNWFADRDGVVRAGVDYSEDRVRLYYRSAAGEDLHRIDSRRYPRDGSVIDMIRFVTDTDHGIVVTNAVTGRFGIYDYNFATDTRGDAIFEHPTADVTAPIMGADGHVDGVTYEDDRRRIRWINPELQRIQERIDQALPNKVNLILGRSDDGMRILLSSSAADDPGTYYVFDRRTRRIEAFAQPYTLLAAHRFAPVRPISFHGRDGTEIPGYLTLPLGREGRGLPLVLMPHGGPFARDSWDFDPWVQFLASRGYAVLQVNFRGSTGYGRAYAERGIGQWGTGMIDDIEDGVDWLVHEGIADGGRVCIMGASYGGYAALWAPIRHPERYRCAISFAGVTDVRAMLRYDSRRFTATRYSREWRRWVEGEEHSDMDAISPLRQAARISVPLLVAHGERDRNVPVAQSHDLIRAIARAGTGANVESIFYPEAVHGFTRPQDSTDFLRRVEAFLAAHNPATVAAPAAVHNPVTVAAPAAAPAVVH